LNVTTNNKSGSIDLGDIASNVRTQIAKWQRKQTQDQLKQLKEHEQFEVRVSESKEPDIPANVCITCAMCDKRLPLSMERKYGSFSISNWSRHVKLCILKKYQKAKKVTQPTISNFLPHGHITKKASKTEASKGELLESNRESSPHQSTLESSIGKQANVTSSSLETSSDVNSEQDFQ